MVRGQIQIKRIENATNRQVTYSKRRKGLLKKADGLTVLCDAKVSIIMLSASNKLHEYTSPSTTTKEMIDLYQQTTGVDIWSSQYERMQKELKELEEINKRLKTEMRQQMGYSLEELSMEEVHTLELKMTESVQIIRDRKNKIIENQIGTLKKKVRSATQMQGALVHELNEHTVDWERYEAAVLFPGDRAPNSFLHSAGRSDTTHAQMSSTSDLML